MLRFVKSSELGVSSKKMNQIEFLELLHKSTILAIDFAKEHVINELPDSYLYSINISETYDGLREDEETFIEEAMPNHKFTKPLKAEEVVKKLLKNSKVPVWIDINVFKTDKHFTYFRLECCNRYSAKDNMYYYRKNGTGPFGIKSPILPPRWSKEKGKFDLEVRQKLFHKMSFLMLKRLIKNIFVK